MAVWMPLKTDKPVITIPVPEPANTRSDLALVLEGAREKVRRGWVQGMGQNGDGSKVCAAYALGWAAHRLGFSDSLQFTAQVVLLKAAEEDTTVMWSSVPEWNDTPGRTLTEVIDTFDHAIKLVERDR